MEIGRPQLTQVKIALDERELIQLRAADDYFRAMARILHPVRSQTRPDAQEGVAGVLLKFEEMRNPAAMALVANVLDIQEPLQGERLGSGTDAIDGPKDFGGDQGRGG